MVVALEDIENMGTVDAVGHTTDERGVWIGAYGRAKLVGRGDAAARRIANEELDAARALVAYERENGNNAISG